jgi:hypothetical protein
MQIVSIAARLHMPMAAVALALGLAAGGAGAATPASTAAPLFALSRITAVSVPAESATRFTVTLAGVPADDAPSFSWYLQLARTAPGSRAASCTNRVLAGGARLSQLEYRWTNQGASFTWYHGAVGSYRADRSYGCDQSAIGRSGYPGTVTLVVENEYQHCTASFPGLDAGTKPELGPPASCALGGYSLTASLLPVPAALLALYGRVDTELGAILARARHGGVTPAGALADSLNAILQEQSSAYGRLFPPVWGCDFDGLFHAVVVARTAFAQPAPAGSLADDSTDMRQLDRALASCERSATNPDGAPRAVVAQAERLSAEASALRAGAGRGSGAAALLARRRAGIAASLDSLVTREFPTVFGMSFIGLVEHTLEISAAAARAERAARAPRSVGTVAAVEGILAPERAISRALHTQQQRVVRAENKNS